MTSNKADIIVGIQWGDEGKGRIVDLYAQNYDVVARFGGGDNAGHSIRVGDQALALRIVPSGVLQPHVELFVGGGTVIGLDGLLGELDKLSNLGIDISRVRISDRAHVVLPYHAAADRADEVARGENAIGTTGRGIGPAYVDKVGRSGITFGDLAYPDRVSARIDANLERRRVTYGDAAMPSQGEVVQATLTAARRILPHIVDGVSYIHDAMARGRVLVEGAQGSLLDVGYGTYPYVTSSHTIAGGACIGLGIGPTAIGSVTGVVKAYCTRVGAGPFPSELHDDLGRQLRTQGGEFGTVTGRPRRCGWFDAVAARYAVALNGLTAAALTKLDVLSGIPTIGIVTGYRLDGRPCGFSAIGEPGFEIEIEEMDGWAEPIDAIRRISDLPKAARVYVARLESLLGVSIEMVSVGPERSQLAR